MQNRCDECGGYLSEDNSCLNCHGDKPTTFSDFELSDSDKTHIEMQGLFKRFYVQMINALRIPKKYFGNDGEI